MEYLLENVFGLPMTKTVTYRLRSGDAPINQTWLAYVVMPNGKLWMVTSFGASEEEAVNKIVALWESERAKLPAHTASEPIDNRGHHLKGLVWVIEKWSRAKLRVTEEVANAYLAAGTHERGGPRSK